MVEAFVIIGIGMIAIALLMALIGLVCLAYVLIAKRPKHH